MSMYWEKVQAELTYEKADEVIKNTKEILMQLEELVKIDEQYKGNKIDTSVYFNWLGEDGD